MYQLGDWLFTGDTLVSHGDSVAPIPTVFADAPDQIRPSVRRMLDWEFNQMADGHSGYTKNPKPMVKAWISK